ncbi:hypothetical protein AX17_003650 [Amanita inopinata Kibby_2008]|nr:hypothetical protein AX17_003650 [Amanita inopinata Kibby_2008]
MALRGVTPPTTSTSTSSRTTFGNPTITTTDASNPSTTATATAPGGPSSHVMSPELEQTLAMLSSHRSVLGYMLVSRGHPASIIRHSGVIFEGEQGRRYASVIARIVESVQGGLDEIHAGETDGDDVRFLRIRTKRHELMISPDDRYLLAVLHDPAT